MTTASQTFRADGYFSARAQAYDNNLAEDLVHVFVLSYYMMKKSLMGFAVLGIPFWVATVGVLSMM